MTHEQRPKRKWRLPKRVDQDSVIKGIMDKLPECSLGRIHEILFKKTAQENNEMHRDEESWNSLKELKDDISVLEYIHAKLETLHCCIEKKDCDDLISFISGRLQVMRQFARKENRWKGGRGETPSQLIGVAKKPFTIALAKLKAKAQLEDLEQQRRNEWRRRPMEKWTTNDVASWARSFGKNYAQEFLDTGIDGILLNELDEEDLQVILPGAEENHLTMIWNDVQRRRRETFLSPDERLFRVHELVCGGEELPEAVIQKIRAIVCSRS